ncbi:MAG: BglII/BstYI family type II restriction endonuclease [Terracidiphilus sp.]
MTWQDYIPEDVRNLFEVHDFRHAACILASEFPEEFGEILDALRAFRITTTDITKSGGNESNIPKIISKILRPLGWKEDQLKAEMVVDGTVVRSDSHKVDYIKGRVAFDLEWNSKDQTFDRDLFAFRSFHDNGRISAGVLLTRSAELNPVFEALGQAGKYGASTTWMGKLLPRLNAGRGGGCPILVFGITPRLISDWKEGLGK